MKKININQIAQIVNTLPFLWLLSGYLLISNGQTYLAYFLVFATVFNLVSKQRNKSLKLARKSVIGSVALYAFVLLINYLYTEQFWPVIRSTLYFVPFALTTPLKAKSLQRVLLILPITSGALCCLYFMNGDSRFLDSSGLNPIPLGTVMALYLSLTIYAIFEFRKEKLFTIYMTSGLFLIVFPILKNETRGVWLATLSLLVIVGYPFIKSTIRKYSLVIKLILAFISLAISFSFFYNITSERIEKTKNEIASIESGDYSSSIGVRLELWKTSFQLLEKKHFIFPAKEEEIFSYFEEQYKEQKITKTTYFYSSNSHNQYINSWLRSGILGLISTLFLLFFPLWVQVKQYGFDDSKLIIMLSCVISICGLTELPLTQIAAYQAFLMSMLASVILVEQKA
ncbi:O-antigen ligase family protein [Vibrio sp. TRT 29B02]|uniref:O-antigen ligase family protein n=1 Tax=Vibrio sp. TRT 29B02 TaxID=3418508 RepID=UPI003CEA8503